MARRFIIYEGQLEALAAGPVVSVDGDGAMQRTDEGGDVVLLLPSGEDDAPAIRQALEEHAHVRLAPGAFTLGAPLVVPPGRTLAGSGPAHTTLRAAQTAGHALAIVDAAGGVSVEGLTLVAPPGSPARQCGIFASSPGGRLRFRELEIRGFGGDGLSVEGAAHVEMDGVEAYDVGGDGVAISGAERVEAARLRVHDAGECGVRVAARGDARLAELDVAAAAVGLAVDAGPGRVMADALRLYGCDAELRIDPAAEVVLDGRAAGR